MEAINSLTTRAKVAIVITSIFLVSLTVGLLAFGSDVTTGDSIHIDSMHSVTSDMIMVPHGGEAEH